MTEERAHSMIGASGFDRWSKCAGSVRLQRVAEEYGYGGSSEYAIEGSAAHEVAADCVMNERDTWEWVGETVFLPKDNAERTVTLEMADAVQTWVDTILEDARAYEQDTGERPTILTEVKFDLSGIREGMFGTSDVTMLLPEWGLIRVFDYKHGIGVPVDVVENGQLLYYAVGVIEYLANQRAFYDNVELVVVQPRNATYTTKVRRWQLSLNDLADWTAGTLIPAVDRTLDPNAPLVPGDHCRFCPARMICPALIALAMEAFDMADQDLKPLSDEQLTEWMAKKDALKHFLTALDQEVENRLRNGRKLPGFKLVTKRANRTWVDGAEKTLKEKLGDSIYNTSLKSPAQVEKMRGGKELAKKLAYKPETGLTVAKANDARPEAPPPAVEAFKDV